MKKRAPKQTMYSDFIEKHPNAPLHRPGRPMLCPYECGYCDNNLTLCKVLTCRECWQREIEKEGM